MHTTHARVIFSDAWPSVIVPASVETEVVPLAVPAIGIGEVREITAEAYRRPTVGSAKMIVVRAGSFTSEAQQAFLKTLEEPPGSTIIVLVLPIGTSLLPTVRSRVQIEIDATQVDNGVFLSWLQSSVGERLATIEAAAKSKDEVFFISMGQGLRAYLATNRHTIGSRALASAQYVLLHLRTRGASNKMLLEELALSLPVSSL